MPQTLRTSVTNLITSHNFERTVIAVILANSLVLGLETYRPLYENNRTLFVILDKTFLAFFVGELGLRLYAYRWHFFRGGWNWFDFVIVLVSLLPFLGNLSALRALRILRALRLLSAIPEFREVTESLVRAAKGASAVFGIIALLLYVFAVMSSKLFGVTHPEYFANLQTSLFTHVQLMVFDGWGETVGTVMNSSGFIAFWYFLGFSLIVGFVLISMLIGVIVDAKQTVTNDELLKEIRKLQEQPQSRSLG
jgi:voltage-gated sodium channel